VVLDAEWVAARVKVAGASALVVWAEVQPPVHAGIVFVRNVVIKNRINVDCLALNKSVRNAARLW